MDVIFHIVVGLIYVFVVYPVAIEFPNLFRPVKQCPTCHAPFPLVRWWETRPQMEWGKWVCHNCGCETCRNGRLSPSR
jgi:hypothetical protein